MFFYKITCLHCIQKLESLRGVLQPTSSRWPLHSRFQPRKGHLLVQTTSLWRTWNIWNDLWIPSQLLHLGSNLTSNFFFLKRHRCQKNGHQQTGGHEIWHRAPNFIRDIFAGSNTSNLPYMKSWSLIPPILGIHLVIPDNFWSFHSPKLSGHRSLWKKQLQVTKIH